MILFKTENYIVSRVEQKKSENNISLKKFASPYVLLKTSMGLLSYTICVTLCQTLWHGCKSTLADKIARTMNFDTKTIKLPQQTGQKLLVLTFCHLKKMLLCWV